MTAVMSHAQAGVIVVCQIVSALGVVGIAGAVWRRRV